MTKWSVEMADTEARTSQRDRPPTDEQMKRMTAAGQKYGECMTKAMSLGAEPPPPEPPAPIKGDPVPTAVPTSPNLPPPSYGTLWADRLWADARTWTRAKREGRQLASATFAYVDRHGALDRADGEVTLVFGRVDDGDSKRKLGAKVRPKQPHTDCFQLSTTTGTWNETSTECVDTSADPLRCTVAQIWQRAIAKKAPEEALATITVSGATSKSWTFVIEDEPRKVHIQHIFADDCELAVEQ
jgi:hypothetical protein